MNGKWCGQQTSHHLGEADTVESDGDRLCQEQHQTDGAAELVAQGARDEIVVTAALDPKIGGHR